MESFIFKNTMLLAQDRTPLFPIHVAPEVLADAESPALFAAQELRYYLNRMTAASFVLESGDDSGALFVGFASGDLAARLGDDGFRIDATPSGATILGGRRGVLYGVYALLESLGCRFFTHDCEKVPFLPSLSLPELHREETPAFEYREHNYADVVQNPRFAAKCRFNGSMHKIPERLGGCMRYALFVHTFERLVPTSRYGADHPEYFALENGKRNITSGGRTQLCLTNPDVLRIATEACRKVLRANPEARILSVSQNDWKTHCECDACRRVDEEEGSPSGTLLRFVNAIAEALEPEFPDVVFDTLAYHYSRPAPKITRNRRNVCVRLCSIECCFAHPFDGCDDPTRAVHRPDGTESSFIRDLTDWGRICDRMYIWDYTTNFAHYPMPYPNWRVLQPNVRLMRANHVRGVFEQACGASRGSTDFNELRLYLISKLLWDPDCDLGQHRREFMEHVYGAAAPALTEYLDLLCDTVARSDEHIGFNDELNHAYLDEAMLDQYDALFDRAAEAVQGDALRLWRVERHRLSLRWARLKRAAMLRHELDAEAANRFFADWRAFGLSRIDEWANLETTHRALLDNHWRGVAYFEHWTGEGPEFL